MNSPNPSTPAASPAGASPPRRRNLRAALLPRVAGLARRVPVPLFMAARPLVAGALRHVPGWREKVRRGMEAALGPDGYRKEHVDAYFRHLADLFAYSAAIFKSGVSGCGVEREWRDDPGFDERFRAVRSRLREVLEPGKGAVLVAPHMVNHEVMLGLLAQELPVTTLVRKSSDPVYEALKQQWYAGLGVETVYRPPKSGKDQGLGEMAAAVKALKRNRVLALTPDLLQPRRKGIPVSLFGRTAELPPGPFFLSARMGTPLMAIFVGREEGRFRLDLHGPLVPDPACDRDAAVADLAQQWASHFEAFVRANPDRWQFWLDRSWQRWLHS